MEFKKVNKITQKTS